MSQPGGQGTALSSLLDEFPYLRHYASTITTDCSGIATIVSNSPAQTMFHALFTTLEGAFAHLDNSVTDSQARAETLLQDKNNLQALVNKLSDQLASRSDVISTIRRITSDPDKFSGTEKDIARRQREYINWRAQINRVFAVDSSVFNSDFRQITHIQGLLAGTAYDLNRDSFNTIIDNPADPELWTWRTAPQVFAHLNVLYETLDLSREASMKFDEFRMGGLPFQNFIAEFNTLSAQCGKTNEQKVDALRIKVSQELSTAVQFRDKKPLKTDFTGWCTLYQKIWEDLQDNKHIDKLRQNANTFRTTPPGTQTRTNPAPVTTTNQSAPADDAMQLDAMQAKGGRPRPTREDCIAQGLCFYCKKKGHTRDTCEEKKKNDTKYGEPRPPNQPIGQVIGRNVNGGYYTSFQPQQPSPRPQYLQQSGYPHQQQYDRPNFSQNGFPSQPSRGNSPLQPQVNRTGYTNWAQHPRLRALETGQYDNDSFSTTSSASPPVGGGEQLILNTPTENE
ncbi:MAG: hypothetical protein JWP34_5374 [Massilia sp.]|nr:hypothetical protein [Massilia sp.]